MNCRSCGHSVKAHLNMGRCSVQRCECRDFHFPESIKWYKVTKVHDENRIELWDGESRLEWGDLITSTYTIPEHSLQVGDEVIMSIVYVRRHAQ